MEAATSRRRARLGTSVVALLVLGLALVNSEQLVLASEISNDQSKEFLDTDDQLADIGRRFPAFGGSFIDSEGTFQLWLTADMEDTTALLDALDGVLDVDMRVHTVSTKTARYSYVQLKHWHDAIRSKLRERLSTDVSSGFDERHNRLTVLIDDAAERREEVSEHLAAMEIPQQAVSVGERSRIENFSDLTDLHRPLVAGLHIEFFVDIPCTYGFTGAQGTTSGFVTAAHCSANPHQVDDELYGQPTLANYIGQETTDSPYFSGGECPPGHICTHADALFASRAPLVEAKRRIARLPLDSGTGWNDANTYRITEKAIGSPTVGQILNKVGRSTGRTTGEVTSNCLDVDFGDYIKLCQGEVSATGSGSLATHGDSGSAVFRIMNTPQTHDVRLMGVLWGGSTNDNNFYYSKMSQVQEVLGELTVCHDGTC